VTNTGTLLTGAVTVAGLGGSYLSSTAQHPAAAHLGLARVVVAVDLLPAVTTACAGWTVMRRRPAA
jgi:hypothetical protein